MVPSGEGECTKGVSKIVLLPDTSPKRQYPGYRKRGPLSTSSSTASSSSSSKVRYVHKGKQRESRLEFLMVWFERGEITPKDKLSQAFLASNFAR